MSANLNFPVAAAQKVVDIWTPSLQGLLDEGSLYVATNTTVGTPIATTTSVVDAGNSGATSAQTRPVSIIFNSNAASSNRVIYPLTWNMILSQVPTSATMWMLGMWLEPIGATAYTSGGSAITPSPMNWTLGQPQSRAQIYFGAITAAASSTSAVRVALRQVNSAVPVTRDQWMFVFGMNRGSDQVAGGAGAKNVNIGLPPIGIPPQWALKVGMWGTSNAAAPSWEFELVYAERDVGQ